MKSIYKFILLIFLFTSCNEDEILREVPLDFASPENAFVSSDDFNIALNGLYSQVREILSESGRSLDHHYGTDLGLNNTAASSTRFATYNLLVSNASEAQWHWSKYYKLIYSANIIISRLKDAEFSNEEKSEIEATAKFFRGLAYKNLAHLYGGVPIELEEVSSPKTDYTRATREVVYQQAISDMIFAAENLKTIDVVADWQVSNIAAYHILAELYNTVQKWDDAIAAASVVIDDPNTTLMLERFGTRSSEPGDVYWDLFRRGNQNRSSGNTEAIMVWQYEVDVLGGVQESSSRTGPILERSWGPFIGVLPIEDPNGVSPFLFPVSDYTGGRGTATCRGTNHFLYGIWEDGDIRNSPYNFVRDVTFNNPESIWYGDSLVASLNYSWVRGIADSTRWWTPYPTKVTTPGNHPEGLFVNRDLNLLSNSAGTTYTDQYFIRLAETYLLRAEAYLGKGDLQNAANDINVVRNRSNAPEVVPSDVDIDYILDERLRELGPEEPRRLTLQRLDLLYERVTRYGNVTYNQNMNFGYDIQPFHELWPIPFSEIERNTDAVLEQNPGYSAQ